jgi:hypothetical protein
MDPTDAMMRRETHRLRTKPPFIAAANRARVPELLWNPFFLPGKYSLPILAYLTPPQI